MAQQARPPLQPVETPPDQYPFSFGSEADSSRAADALAAVTRDLGALPRAVTLLAAKLLLQQVAVTLCARVYKQDAALRRAAPSVRQAMSRRCTGRLYQHLRIRAMIFAVLV